MPRYTQDAFDLAAIGMALVDLEGRWIRVNPALTEILGYSREELLATTFQALTHPDDLDADLAHVRQLIAGAARDYSMAKRYIHESGRIVWATLTVRLVRDAAGAPEYFIAQVQDISAQREATAALAESRSLLHAVIQASPAAIIATTREGRVCLWNAAAERLLGWRADEVMGHPPPQVPPYRTEEYQSLLAAAARGEVVELRTERLHRNGTRIPVLVSAAGMFDPERRFVGFVAVLVDLTELERLESDLRQAQKLDAIGQLTAGIAHDFNNILAAIRSHADLLQATALDQEQRASAVEIAGAVDRGAALTRQLLVFTRKQLAHVTTIDLAHVLRGVERLLVRLLMPEVVLDVRCETAGPVLVRADMGQMEQLLVNLVVNARDAMPDGGTIQVTLATATLDSGRRGDLGAVPKGTYATLSVADTGDGIAPDVLPHVIEPFFSTKSRGGGTGLGLSTVLGITTQHRGHFTIDTTPGQGTRATVYLPLHTADPAPAHPPPASTSVTRVMVVDDDDVVRRALVRLLRRKGLEVLEATNGSHALEQLKSAPPDLRVVISDVLMPGISGVELAQQAMTLFPRLRFILTSGYGEKPPAAPGARVAYEFLPKPYDIDELLRLIQRSAVDAP